MRPRVACFPILALVFCFSRLAAAPFSPNDPYFFYNPITLPGFPGEWTLQNTAPSRLVANYGGGPSVLVNTGIDVNARGAWNLGYTGKGVVIGFIDEGIDSTNPDIAPNYRADLSRNFTQNPQLAAQPPAPIEPSENHATAVAGIAAARGGNGIGVTGVAPYAGIASLRINLTGATPTDPGLYFQDLANAYLWQTGVDPSGIIDDPAVITIKNNSYGVTAPFAFDLGASGLRQILFRTSLNDVINVFAAGNARGLTNEDTARNALTDSPDIIVVAAVGSTGTFSSYSSFGSNVFVSAPSNTAGGLSVTTTDRSGPDAGYNKYSKQNPNGIPSDKFPNTDYTSIFGGTSAAAPLVSGILALGKQANPDMDVRMAKYALAATSEEIDPNDNSASSFGGWRTNGAGYHFDPNYGFGNINAGAFVQAIQNTAWVTQTTQITQLVFSPKTIPGGNAQRVTQVFQFNPNALSQQVEDVGVQIGLIHPDRGNLQIVLSSPSGMVSRLLAPTTSLPPSQQDNAPIDFYWTFYSNAFWGENPVGNWDLNVSDAVPGDPDGTWAGTIITWRMGAAVAQQPGTMVVNNNVNADSLAVSNPETTLVLADNIFFQVRDNVRISGGSLIVNGQITEAPLKSGIGVYLTGGAIAGHGIINASQGFYNTGGTVQSGVTLGALTIRGNYIQASGGTYSVQIGGAQTSAMQVTGNANLSGTLQTTLLTGFTPTLGMTMPILNAGSISGQFTQLLTNINPTLIFQPVYAATSVTLKVASAFANPTLAQFLTPSQLSAAQMLDRVAPYATGDLSQVLAQINSLANPQDVVSAYAQMAPRELGARSEMAISGATLQSHNLANRLRDLRRGLNGLSVNGLSVVTDRANVRGGDYGAPISNIGERWGFFVTGSAVFGDQTGSASNNGYTFTTAGLTVGGDYRITDQWAAGLFAGFNESGASLDSAGSTLNVSSYSFGAYTTAALGNWYVDGMASYGFNQYDTRRNIQFAAINRTANGQSNGQQLTVYAGTGYDWHAGGFTFGPTASLQYVHLMFDGYTESNANALDLSVNGGNQDSLQGSLGAQVSYLWKQKDFSLAPSLYASYVHEFEDGVQTYGASLAGVGGSGFNTTTPAAGRDFALLGAAISFFLGDNWSFYLDYDAQVGQQNFTAQSIDGGVRLSF